MMNDDLMKRIKDRGDWLVDAVALATQNRQFLRGDPECDAVACDAIRMNGEEAMEMVAKPLTDRIEALTAENRQLRAVLANTMQAVDAIEFFTAENKRLRNDLAKAMQAVDAIEWFGEISAADALNTEKRFKFTKMEGNEK